MMKNHAIFFVLAVVAGVVLDAAHGFDGETRDETGCPAAFRKKCTCKEQSYAYWHPERNNTFVVNCTNTRFHQADMLEMLPDETEVLIFNGNNIPYLKHNLLGITQEHELLKVIDLSNNNITEIAGKAFHKVASVEVLILNHNNLRITGEEHHRRILTNFYSLRELRLTNAFTEIIDSKYYLDDLQDIFLASNMTTLYKLHLGQNEIWSISDRLFCSLPALSDLYLENNQIYDINFGFACIKKLRFLDLSYNKIKRLRSSTLKRIDETFHQPQRSTDPIRKLNLLGNPFVCDCNLIPFQRWLSESTANLYKKDQLRCNTGTPERNAGRRIMVAKELICEHQPARHASGSGITHALLVILIILVAVLLSVLLYINRERVHANVQPLVDNFQRSMQYKTIEKDLQESNVVGANAASSSNQPPPEVNV